MDGQELDTLPTTRPEVPQRIRDQVARWFERVNRLVQRDRALKTAQEAHKLLFPAQFDASDPLRGRKIKEAKTGEDIRRVNVPILYRRSIQSTAMLVPGDISFDFIPEEQTPPEENPMVAMAPALTGAVGPDAGLSVQQPGTSPYSDANVLRFATTLRIVLTRLLKEANWVSKLQAVAQDAYCFPMAVLKYTFYRDYRSSPSSETPLDRDSTDNVARLEALMQRFSKKEFTEDSAEYADMLQLVEGLNGAAEMAVWYGLELSNVQLDSFGISEECTDLVNIYDAPWMFHDVVMRGEDILAKYPYRVGADGETFGLLPDELCSAISFDTAKKSKIFSAGSDRLERTTRNRESFSTQDVIESRSKQYIVREVWSKQDRMVYVMIDGVDHYIERFVPQKMSETWYPFLIFAPQRVPTEIYGASNVELGAEHQERINRKLTELEKARFLSLVRFIYNNENIAEQEILKLKDIPPGQFRGINLGLGLQGDIEKVIMPLAYKYDPAAFDTTRDERDLDQMDAQPVQTMSTTGVANYAAEVHLAAQGASVSTAYRQFKFLQEIERLLISCAQLCLQNMSVEEAQEIAGPHAVFPEIYDAKEFQSLRKDAQERAKKAVVGSVIQQMAITAQMGSIPLAGEEIVRAIEAQAEPIWQQEIMQKFGSLTPMTRENLFRQVHVTVRSSVTTMLDRQARIQAVGAIAESTAQLSQAAQIARLPFNPRAMLEFAARILGEESSIQGMFPSVPQQPSMNPLQSDIAMQSGAPGVKKSQQNQGGVMQDSDETKGVTQNVG